MKKSRLVMIGNGMAGVRALEELLKIAPELYDITVFGAEPHPNYNRILLSPVLAGDTSAQAWITTLLRDELPAQAYGRLLLLPGAKPPVAVQSRGKVVCSCLNVTDAAIDAHLALPALGSAGDEARLASLQDALKCGTSCGSCVPELKRRLRSARGDMAAPARTVIPIRQPA